MSTPGGWFSALPVVMRAWGVSCVATTCAVSAGLVSPYRIALDWGLLLRRFQVSRALPEYSLYFLNNLSPP